MITFNGMNLVTAIPSIRIIDYTIGAPDVEVTARDKALLPGSLFVRRRYGTRDVRISAMIPTDVMADRETTRNALLAWAQSDTPQALELDRVPGKHLTAICTGLPDFSARQWWVEFGIGFTAMDPYFISDSQQTEAVGTAFTIAGNGPALATIEQTITAVLTNPQWILDGGYSILINGTVAVGALVINLDTRLVTLNGTPIMSDVSIGSRFFTLTPGSHTIVGTNGAAGNVKWYERYL